MTTDEARAKLAELDEKYGAILDAIEANGLDPRQYDAVWQEWIKEAAPLERIIGA